MAGPDVNASERTTYSCGRAWVAQEYVVRDAHFQNGMRVRSANAGQLVLSGEDGGLLVSGPAVYAGVIDLDPIHFIGDVLELGTARAPVATRTIERMRDADEAALLADVRARIHGGKAGRHRSLQKSGDPGAVGRCDFLADDDRQTVRSGITGS